MHLHTLPLQETGHTHTEGKKTTEVNQVWPYANLAHLDVWPFSLGLLLVNEIIGYWLR